MLSVSVDEWGGNPSTVEAIATAFAVVVAGVAVVFASKAAKRQTEISERQTELNARLVAIEEERDMPRLRVLASFYTEVEPRDDPCALVTVTNIGSVLGGPVSVSLSNADGDDLSYMHSDPLFIKPGEMKSVAVYFATADGRYFEVDYDRRGQSDVPPDTPGKVSWQAARLRRGYFIRVWDAMEERSAWYPERPPNEPSGPPTIV